MNTTPDPLMAYPLPLGGGGGDEEEAPTISKKAGRPPPQSGVTLQSGRPLADWRCSISVSRLEARPQGWDAHGVSTPEGGNQRHRPPPPAGTNGTGRGPWHRAGSAFPSVAASWQGGPKARRKEHQEPIWGGQSQECWASGGRPMQSRRGGVLRPGKPLGQP